MKCENTPRTRRRVGMVAEQGFVVRRDVFEPHLPGAPDQALAAWWTLVLPVLDRLTGRRPRRTVTLPLVRKIASQVGLAEIVLLERSDGGFVPLAIGDLPLQIIARADAWLVVPGGSEGFAAGGKVNAYMLRE